MEKAMFAAGCFWGVQAYFDRIKGVVSTTVGYSGGHTKYPTYEEVCTDRTGHAETLLIEFVPDVVPYSELLKHFFKMHDPTTLNQQGPDIGSQYRSAVFYFDERQKTWAEKMKDRYERSTGKRTATEITKAGPFYKAEDLHQKYFDKNGFVGCHIALPE